MANTSTKNFPNAYGAGRCVAAFSLSHPGGPFQAGDEANDASMLSPPAFKMVQESAAVPSYPDRSETFTPYDPSVPTLGEKRFAYTPNRQPYNATSFGVYCTGSGTKALPYRDALAPFVPLTTSPSLHAVLPGFTAADNEVRPFNVVEETRLGTMRAQVVVASEDSEGGPQPGTACWYEVGLDWTVPDIKIELQSLVSFEFPSNWASTQLANVRDSIMKTLWIQASIGDTATAEPHPQQTGGPGFVSRGSNTLAELQPPLMTNPQPGSGYEAPYCNAFSYGADPFLGTVNLIEPDEPLTSPLLAAPDAFPMLAPRADIALKITQVQQIITNWDEGVGGPTLESKVTQVFKVAPVVRVWVMHYVAALNVARALPLARSDVRVSSQDDGYSPPCVNVQVWQKNSSATDGSDTPIFDLGPEAWSELGG